MQSTREENESRRYPLVCESPTVFWSCPKALVMKPSFMRTTKFVGIFVLPNHLGRRLAKPLSALQLQYLEILELNREIFTKPPGKRKAKKRQHLKITENSS
jgi:hypothetical protein